MYKDFVPNRSITIYEAIEEYFDEKEATEYLSSSTVYNRRYELKRFHRFCAKNNISNPENIHKNTVISYLKSLHLNRASKLHIIYVLKGFFDFLVDEELVLDNIADSIKKPKNYQPKTDFLNYAELEKLYQTEAKYAQRKAIDRNLLLFSLFTDICLRVSEVIQLQMNDVRIETKEIWIVRKRNKVEKIPLNEDIIAKFLNWYEIRKEYKGSEQDWVFLSSHGKQLKRRQVYYIVSKALERAGIVKRKQGPHLLRHSGASLKAKAGENIVMIQYLLGHENMNTTRRYLHFDWKDLQDMVERSPQIKKEEEKSEIK
ncbi:MAG: tyrosine-type recombinase/integrase [Desulfococcaceae bacterium]|jgi:site-specific recombinase XerD|nr:tyrosine-type recombinase/integrase [Desulfococcaceae bacterium]